MVQADGGESIHEFSYCLFIIKGGNALSCVISVCFPCRFIHFLSRNVTFRDMDVTFLLAKGNALSCKRLPFVY